MLCTKITEGPEWRKSERHECKTVNNGITRCQTKRTQLREGRERHESARVIFFALASGALWSRCPSVAPLTLGGASLSRCARRRWCVCVCVCVCVRARARARASMCVCARERERERACSTPENTLQNTITTNNNNNNKNNLMWHCTWKQVMADIQQQEDQYRARQVTDDGQTDVKLPTIQIDTWIDPPSNGSPRPRA